MRYFLKAKRIWAKDHLDELNSNLIFYTNFTKRDSVKLIIAGNNVFSIYLNGKLVHYGPARAAHDRYRVDELTFNELKNKNHLVIFVNGSNANTFYTLNTKPFLIAEVRTNDEILASTGENFSVLNNIFRIRNVLRYSYQRGFSESYKLDHRYNDIFKGNFKDIKEENLVELADDNEYFSRNVNYISFENVKAKLIEKGSVSTNESLPLYDDRYMHLEFLKIFPLDEIEENPNLKVCKYEYKMSQKSRGLHSKEFLTYKLENSYTGFFKIELNIEKTSLISIIFDEIAENKGENKPLKINCFRNTTNNIISLKLEKGKYNFINFEPYSAKYIRVICDDGEVKNLSISLMKYETKKLNEIEFLFKDKKVQSIMEAIYSTYKQNSVDIFTDCPSRERAGWLCDSFFEGKAAEILDDNYFVEKNFLENYAYFKSPKLPKNMVPMCYPAELKEDDFIPQWSLWYILELYDYKKRTGDFETVNLSLQNVENLLKYFSQYETKEGYIYNLPGWNFVEWSDANLESHLQGINFPTNMLYSEALIMAGKLLDKQNLIQKGKKLKEMIKKDAFDGEFFVDNAYLNPDGTLTRSKYYTETCQYYAFFFNIVDQNEYQKLFNILLKNFGPNGKKIEKYSKLSPANVLPGYILRLFTLNNYGLLEESFKEIVGYFYEMSTLTGTLWEHNSTFASLNHGFTAVISNFLMRDYFGLVEIDSIKREIHIARDHLNKVGKVKIFINNEPLELENNGYNVKISNSTNYKLVYETN